MKKEILKIMSVIIFFIFAFTSLSSGSGIDDERLRNTNNTDRPELNSTDTVATVTVSSDVSLANGAQPSSNTESPGTGAQAVASGYIQSGKSKNEVVSGLTQLGYTQTEAEIAYSKASANAVTETVAQTTTEPAPAAETVEPPSAEINQDTVADPVKVSAADYIKNSGVSKPTGKFFRWSAQSKQQYSQLVKEMQAQGYTMEEIAVGLKATGLSYGSIAGVLGYCGVSLSDTKSILKSIGMAIGKHWFGGWIANFIINFNWRSGVNSQGV